MKSVSRELQFPCVKPQQMKGIIKRDVFVALPTEHGKSACFQSLPLADGQLLSKCKSAICSALLKDHSHNETFQQNVYLQRNV